MNKTTLLRCLLALGLVQGIWAAEAGPLVAKPGGFTLGGDATIDSSIGLAGDAGGREALHGMGLVHGGWTSAAPAGAEPTWETYASVLWVDGRGPTERVAGDALGASNTEAYQSLRLYSWWAEGRSGAWSLRAGALLADEEFAATEAGSWLVNSAFGWPAFISANTLNAGPAYYVPALGMRVAYANEASGYNWKFLACDGDSFDSATGDDRVNRHGLHYQFNRNQGVFLLTECGWAPAEARGRGYVGAWYHSAKFADLQSGREKTGNQGAYACIERDLAKRSGEPGHLVAHLRVGAASQDRSPVAWAFDTGLAATGLLATRPEDVLALGFVHADFSSRLAGVDFEEVGELSYTAVINSHLSLKPDVQYIRHPGGTSGRDDEMLFIFRICVSF